MSIELKRAFVIAIGILVSLIAALVSYCSDMDSVAR